jgi:hypothetical protein
MLVGSHRQRCVCPTLRQTVTYCINAHLCVVWLVGVQIVRMFMDVFTRGHHTLVKQYVLIDTVTFVGWHFKTHIVVVIFHRSLTPLVSLSARLIV